ncbi:hypothetical protein SCLCIDRAFT_914274, partial [Scleroderma citrinum Foug A]
KYFIVDWFGYFSDKTPHSGVTIFAPKDFGKGDLRLLCRHGNKGGKGNNLQYSNC